MRFPVLGLGAFALTVAACASSPEGSTPTAAESDLTMRAYEYTCTSSDARILEDAATVKILITNGLLQFTDGYGENLGSRDNSYRTPSGTHRARYDGFEYGGDCTLKLVIDDGAISGAATPELRVQCAGDDFIQDLYTCADPRRARLEIADPQEPGPVQPTHPAADAKKWTCTSGGGALGAQVTMQLDENTMRLVSTEDDLEYLGTRDREYQSRAGNYIGFDDFEYGGDCSLSAVVEETVLTPATTEVTLKVRCAGDDFQQDVYRCSAP